jgi:hypothetical protein
MRDITTAVCQSGVWYLRLPPAFARHIHLDDKETEEYEKPVDMEIQDEVNKNNPKQTYISAWKKGF